MVTKLNDAEVTVLVNPETSPAVAKSGKAAKKAKATKKAPAKSRKAGKAKRPAKAPGKPKADGGRVAEVIAMLKREKGATAEELMERFGWTKPHTARGFLSRLGSVHGVKVTRAKHETRGSVYHA